MRKKRQAQGIYLTEMAKQISYSKSYLSGVENDHVQPSLTLIKSYEKVLHVQLYETEQTPQNILLNTLASEKETGDQEKEWRSRRGEKKQTWRDLLAEILHDHQTREQIVRELNVNRITIARWLNKETVPRLDNLRRLLNVVPIHRKTLYDLLLQDFPDLALHTETDISLDENPSDFHKRILRTYTTIPRNMCFWAISTMVLQHLLEQLDPDLQHVSITLFQCHPSPLHLIRSVRCVMSIGPLSWTNGNQNANGFFQGTESLAGQILVSGYPYSIENIETYTGSLPFTTHSLPRVHQNPATPPRNSQTVPEFQMHPVASEMAAPILRANTRAGVIHITSTRPDAFHTPQLQLLHDCATLATLAFAPEDFYSYEDIRLQIIPPLPLQAPLLSDIPKRILQLMLEAMTDNTPLSQTTAEHMIWEQVEEELIQMAQASV